MPVLELLCDNKTETKYYFECPGCKTCHWIRVRGDRPLWTWNNDLDKPTVNPSIVAHLGPNKICHSFIRDGQIQFLGDCWHELRGQTVELPQID